MRKSASRAMQMRPSEPKAAFTAEKARSWSREPGSQEGADRGVL